MTYLFILLTHLFIILLALVFLKYCTFLFLNCIVLYEYIITYGLLCVRNKHNTITM